MDTDGRNQGGHSSTRSAQRRRRLTGHPWNRPPVLEGNSLPRKAGCDIKAEPEIHEDPVNPG
jgi:hypothetical protein